MGLCKCPKKKVTNLFCFEHRVNVCEFCLVDNHPNCVVQSYLQWLTDSDYDPNCNLCHQSLASDETIRLQCLHLLHWRCFDEWASRFPPTTAPAGYRCPCCSEGVFPPLNQVSPLIEKLREQLKQSNWARAALGLPVLPELNRPVSSIPPPRAHSSVPVPPQNNIPPGVYDVPAPAVFTNTRSATPATHLDIDGVNYSTSQDDVTFSRKKNVGMDSYSDTRPLLPNERDADNEANKYKRRPAGEWLRGLWRAKYGKNIPSEKVSGFKRFVFFLFLVAVVVITVLTVLSRLGAGPSDSDPLLDPLANPNIRVAIDDSHI